MPLRAGAVPRPRPLWRPSAMPQSMAFWCARAMRWNGWHRLPKVAFDKTGTLTYGAPEVAEVCTILPQWPRRGLVCAGGRGRAALGTSAGKSDCARVWQNRRPGACTANGLCHASGPRRDGSGGRGPCGGGHTGPAGPAGGRGAACGHAAGGCIYSTGLHGDISCAGRRRRRLYRPGRYASAGCSRSSWAGEGLRARAGVADGRP